MPKLKTEATELLEEIKQELENTGGRISEKFKDEYAKKCSYEYGKVGDSARICVLTTTTGNKIVGHALILDPKGDVADIGNGIARKNCTEELWGFLGGLAKLLA